MTTTTGAPAQMTVRATGYTVTVPPGTYFLGDPCYAVPDALWMPLLNSCGFFGASPEGGSPVGMVAGGFQTYQVLAFGTAWGDGEYEDQSGHRYSVDSGMIGLTPYALNDGHNDLADLGQVVTFTETETCTDDGKGHLTFGPYMIDTENEPDDEDL